MAAVLTAVSTHAATLLEVSQTFLRPFYQSYDTKKDAKISFFPGSAGFVGQGRDAQTTPIFDTSGTFGDGTVLDYRFFSEDGTTNTIKTVIDGGGGRISNLSTTDTDIASANYADFWTTTDPAGFTSTPNYTGNSAVINLDDHFQGTIDISGLSSGKAYLFYGAYRATPSFTVTMQDNESVSSDIALTNVGDADGSNNDEYYVVELSFVNDAGYDTLKYEYTSSAGRFLGAAIDGVAIIPEPSAALLGGLGLLALLRRRR